MKGPSTSRLLPLLCALALPALISIGLSAPLSAASEPASGLEVKAEVGFDGVAKQDAMTPLFLRVTNRGKGPFAGTAEVAVKTDPLSVIRYQVAVELAPGASKEYELSFLNLSRVGKGLFLVLKNRSGREVAKLPLSIKEAASPQSFLMVSLTPQPGALGFINRFSFARRVVDLYGPQDPELSFSQYVNSQVAVGSLPLGRLPANGAALAGADMLVVLAGDFSRLSSAQVSSLEWFVARGGILLIATGPNGPRIAASPLARLLPRRITGTVAARGLIPPLAGWAGMAEEEAAGAAALLSLGEPFPGSVVLAQADSDQGPVPLLVERRLGSGVVLELNLDPLAEPFQSWPGKKEFMGYLIARYGSNPSLFSALSHPSTMVTAMGSLILKLPALRTTIFLFVLLYLVLVGPANFLILSYLRLQHLLWLTLSLVVVAFTLAGFMLGFRIQGSHNRIFQIDEVVVGPEGGAAYRSATGIFNAAPTQLTTTVPAPGAAYPKVPGKGGGFIGFRFDLNDRATGRVELSGEQIRLRRQRPRWSYDFDFLEGLIPDDRRFSGIRLDNLSLSPQGEVSGELVNRSDQRLYDAILVTPRGSYRLGKLEPGEGKPIDNYQLQYELPIKLGDDRLSAGYIQLMTDLSQRLSKLATSQRLFLVASLAENLVRIEQSSPFRKQGYSVVVVELSGSRLGYRGPAPPAIKQLFLYRLASSIPASNLAMAGGPANTDSLNRLLLNKGEEAVWVVELSPQRASEALRALSFSFSTDYSPFLSPVRPMQRSLGGGQKARQETIVQVYAYHWPSRTYRPIAQVRQWGSALISFFPDWALSPTGQVRIKLSAEEDLVIYDVEARLSPARLSDQPPTDGSAHRPPAGGAG